MTTSLPRPDHHCPDFHERHHNQFTIGRARANENQSSATQLDLNLGIRPFVDGIATDPSTHLPPVLTP
jgi:hypothetical protein